MFNQIALNIKIKHSYPKINIAYKLIKNTLYLRHKKIRFIMFFYNYFSRETQKMTDIATKNNEKRHKLVTEGQGHNILRITYIWLMS